MNKINNQKGFIPLPALIIVGILVGAMAISWISNGNKYAEKNTDENQAQIISIIKTGEKTKQIQNNGNIQEAQNTPLQIIEPTKAPPSLDQKMVYVVKDSEIRECPSFTCESVVKVLKGTMISINKQDDDKEWKTIYNTSNNEIRGYINKTAFEHAYIMATPKPTTSPAQTLSENNLTKTYDSEQIVNAIKELVGKSVLTRIDIYQHTENLYNDYGNEALDIYNLIYEFEIEVNKITENLRKMEVEMTKDLKNLKEFKNTGEYRINLQNATENFINNANMFFESMDHYENILRFLMKNIKIFFENDINNLLEQYKQYLANPTPAPTTGQQGSPGQSVPLNLPPPESEECDDIRNNSNLSRALKALRLEAAGCRT